MWPNNRKRFEALDVVQHYHEQDSLQMPEATAIATVGQRLSGMSMLDIGVGAGRTTLHFANRVKRYHAIDYSSEMIAACNMRFPELGAQGCFSVTDARAMNDIRDSEFDFVLFSFNGIDYVTGDDRIRILNEIRRIMANDGYFCFSTHNLESDIRRTFIPPAGSGYKRRLRRRAKRALFSLLNPHWVFARQTADCMRVNDGTDRFRLRTYYTKPSAQVRQLEEIGFKDVRLFDLKGEEIWIGARRAHAIPDPWLYYLCRA